MKYAYALTAVLWLSLPGLSCGQTFRELVVENHYSYIPEGRGQFPTLIAMPGCSGIASDNPAAEETNTQLHEDDLLFRRHYRYMAEKLKATGFAVILVDVHKAEGLLTACAGEIRSERMADYIDGALAFLEDQPYVDRDNVHIVGWSMGGRGVLEWLDGSRTDTASVRSAIVVYPAGCDEHTSLTMSMPLLMLLGGSDDIAAPSNCETLADSVATRQLITVDKYPGARHGFDIVDAPPVLDIGNGMTIGYQKEAADASWSAIMRFLAASD